MSWPRSADQEPVNVDDNSYSPLFPFGWGIDTRSGPRFDEVARAALRQ